LCCARVTVFVLFFVVMLVFHSSMRL
jgi:hypothetical protein